jgi:hypothetical protein
VRAVAKSVSEMALKGFIRPATMKWLGGYVDIRS